MTPRPLGRWLTTLMALAIGVAVANLYYLQPLLHQVRASFRLSTLATASLITLVQVGYAMGLLLLLPLGDLIARRRLIVAILLVAAAAILLASFVTTFALFAAVTVVVGLTSVAGQIIIPFGADLARAEERGRVVGRLMTGLLGGILLSRTMSGLVSEAIGWRGVYRVAAAALVVMALVMYVVLPTEAARAKVAYPALVGRSLALLRDESELRLRAWYGGCAFGAFSVVWATLAFHLAIAPFHYSTGVIGLFGLFGMAGIVGANFAGKQADQSRENDSTRSGAVALVVGYLTMGVGHANLAALIVGIVVVDAGTQLIHVSNQSVIYALRPHQRSSINSVYMLCFFVGASLGSLLSGMAYSRYGWTGTCVVGALFGVGAVIPAFIGPSSATQRSNKVAI